MKYRSRTEIVAMILEAANGVATTTKIMYNEIGELLQTSEKQYTAV
jgi:hypothetical protein